jgi:lipopolysaccharide biosynthesis glycosyltransferase
MVKSLLAYNPWVKSFDFVILDLGLSEDSKKIIFKNVGKVKYIKPQETNYKDVKYDRLIDPSHVNIYYKLEMFTLTEYSRVISIDSDMLILGDISNIIEYELAAVSNFDRKKGKMKGFNAGLFSVSGNKICKNTYHSLLDIASNNSFRIAEQDVLNEYFAKEVTILSSVYNCKKDIFYSSHCNIDLEKVKVIHYTSQKPWNVSFPDTLLYRGVNKIWLDAKFFYFS